MFLHCLIEGKNSMIKPSKNRDACRKGGNKMNRKKWVALALTGTMLAAGNSMALNAQANDSDEVVM